MLRRPMRRGGMPLVRAAATTAVVAGTAGAVRHHQDQKWANQAAQQQATYDSQQVAYDQQQMAAQMDAMQQQQAALAQQQAMLAQQQQTPQVAAPASTPMDDTVAQLQKLAELQKAGIITEEEFAAKKKVLLGI